MIVIILNLASFAFTFTVHRATKGDIITCPNHVNCSLYDAVMRDRTSCLCKNGGSFFSSYRMQCFKGTGVEEGCRFYFQQGTVPTVSIATRPVGEFPLSIKYETICTDLQISDVEVLSASMNWMYTVSNDLIIKPIGDNSYFLRWRDPNDLNTKLYEGNLIKVHLQCTDEEKRKRSDCIMVKVAGNRTWDDYDLSRPICQGSFPTKSNVILQTSSAPRTSAPVVETGVNSAKIVVITSVTVMLLMLVLVVLLCVVYRRRLAVKKRVVVEDKVDDETRGEEFQNKSYLTSLEIQSLENELYGVPDIENELYGKPDIEYATIYDKNASKEKLNPSYLPLDTVQN